MIKYRCWKVDCGTRKICIQVHEQSLQRPFKKVRNAKTSWQANLEKYNAMKVENEKLRANKAPSHIDLTYEDKAEPLQRHASVLNELTSCKTQIEELKARVTNKELQLAAQKTLARELLEVKEQNRMLQEKLTAEDASPQKRKVKVNTTKLNVFFTDYNAETKPREGQQELATQKELVKTLAVDLEEMKVKNAKLEARVAAEAAVVVEQQVQISRMENEVQSRGVVDNELASQEKLVETLVKDLDDLRLENDELRRNFGKNLVDVDMRKNCDSTVNLREQNQAGERPAEEEKSLRVTQLEEDNTKLKEILAAIQALIGKGFM